MGSNIKKPDRKPFYVYLVIVIIAMLLINMLLLPLFTSRQYQEVDYGTFLDMVDEKSISTVEVKNDYIYFESKDGVYY